MKGNKLIDDHVQIAVNLARLKTHGITFEVAIEPDKVVAYKEGESMEIEELVNSPKIFSDMKKGLIASEEDLQKVFNTLDEKEIIKSILEKGEIQFTQKYRDHLRELKTKKIINLIHRNTINPKTGLVHPENRILAAMEEAKVKINDLKKAEDQVKDIVDKLRPIIPISMEHAIYRIQSLANYAGRVRSKLASMGHIKEENWLSDGSLILKLEIPAGLGQELIDQLNNLTQGTIIVEKIKN